MDRAGNFIAQDLALTEPDNKRRLDTLTDPVKPVIWLTNAEPRDQA